MRATLIDAWSTVDRPVIGMLHLAALPGSPHYGGDLGSVHAAALRDAELLVQGGVDGLLIENYGDRPFFPARVPAHTATHMSVLAAEVRRRFELPLGINVLRNDGRTALAVAHAAGGDFIRVNVLGGARVTDQGLITGIAHDLERDRAVLGAGHIKVFADVNVKHSVPLGDIRPEDEARDLVQRSGVDALIVTGPATGKVTEVEELEAVKAAVGSFPVFVGSGISPESVGIYFSLADGFIVGSYFRRDGKPENPVDSDRVRSLLEKIR